MLETYVSRREVRERLRSGPAGQYNDGVVVTALDEQAEVHGHGIHMFLRFLSAEGKCRAGLEYAIPTFAYWRLSTLPRYLSAPDVERVIVACDDSTEIGARDRAIILFLARLGLRSGDILGLRLNDIDLPFVHLWL